MMKNKTAQILSPEDFFIQHHLHGTKPIIWAPQWKECIRLLRMYGGGIAQWYEHRDDENKAAQSPAMTTELYVDWSHRNFTAEQWREAAERYLELDRKILELEQADARIDHDHDFFVCETCDQIGELNHHLNEFACAFAAIWARKALHQ